MSRQLSKKTLDKSFWNWFFWNGCSQQAESMLGLAFGQAMAPVVDELYDSKEEKAEALKRHVTLFNTEAQVGSICNGIVCGMEEANANGQCTPDVINTVKVALIGPTSAIGDSLWGGHHHPHSPDHMHVHFTGAGQLHGMGGRGHLPAGLSGTDLYPVQEIILLWI